MYKNFYTLISLISGLILLIFLLHIGPTSTHALAEAALREPSRDDIGPLPEHEDDAPSNT